MGPNSAYVDVTAAALPTDTTGPTASRTRTHTPVSASKSKRPTHDQATTSAPSSSATSAPSDTPSASGSDVPLETPTKSPMRSVVRLPASMDTSSSSFSRSPRPRSATRTASRAPSVGASLPFGAVADDNSVGSPPHEPSNSAQAQPLGALGMDVGASKPARGALPEEADGGPLPAWLPRNLLVAGLAVGGPGVILLGVAAVVVRVQARGRSQGRQRGHARLAIVSPGPTPLADRRRTVPPSGIALEDATRVRPQGWNGKEEEARAAQAARTAASHGPPTTVAVTHRQDRRRVAPRQWRHVQRKAVPVGTRIQAWVTGGLGCARTVAGARCARCKWLPGAGQSLTRPSRRWTTITVIKARATKIAA